MAAEEEKKSIDIAENSSPSFKSEVKNEPELTEEESTSALNEPTSVETRKVSSFSLLDDETSPKPPSTETGTSAEEISTPKESEPEEKESTQKFESGKQISSEEVKDWLKDVRPDTTKEIQKGRGRSVVKYLAVLVLLMLVAGALAGGFYYYRQNVEKPAEEQQTEEETQSQEITPEPMEPTATPEPVDLTIFQINVLNGSGVAGQAGDAADLLVDAGFSDPDTANADSFDFEDTVLAVKETVPGSVVEELKKALEENYTVAEEIESLEEDAEYDIIVTVGQSK